MIGFFRRISDERYRRATNRRRTEEIMGWICVPLLLMLGWSLWQAYEQVMNERAAPMRQQTQQPGTLQPPALRQ